MKLLRIERVVLLSHTFVIEYSKSTPRCVCRSIVDSFMQSNEVAAACTWSSKMWDPYHCDDVVNYSHARATLNIIETQFAQMRGVDKRHVVNRWLGPCRYKSVVSAGVAPWFSSTSIINHLVNNHFNCYLQTLFVLYLPFEDKNLFYFFTKWVLKNLIVLSQSQKKKIPEKCFFGTFFKWTYHWYKNEFQYYWYMGWYLSCIGKKNLELEYDLQKIGIMTAHQPSMTG